MTLLIQITDDVVVDVDRIRWMEQRRYPDSQVQTSIRFDESTLTIEAPLALVTARINEGQTRGARE